MALTKVERHYVMTNMDLGLEQLCKDLEKKTKKDVKEIEDLLNSSKAVLPKKIKPKEGRAIVYSPTSKEQDESLFADNENYDDPNIFRYESKK
jgi:hypothetical protein